MGTGRERAGWPLQVCAIEGRHTSSNARPPSLWTQAAVSQPPPKTNTLRAGVLGSTRVSVWLTTLQG